RDRGLSILLIEQNLEFISGLADRILVLKKGQIAGVIDDPSSDNAELIDEFTGFKSGNGTGTETHRPNGKDTRPTTVGAALPHRKPAAVAPPLPPVTALGRAALSSVRPATSPSCAASSSPVVSERPVRMSVKRPTLGQLKAIAEDFGMNL